MGCAMSLVLVLEGVAPSFPVSFAMGFFLFLSPLSVIIRLFGDVAGTHNTSLSVSGHFYLSPFFSD